jgi:hypothetical protein
MLGVRCWVFGAKRLTQNTQRKNEFFLCIPDKKR